jgi:hypothetical protein
MMRALLLYAADLIAYVVVAWWALILIRVSGQAGCGAVLDLFLSRTLVPPLLLIAFSSRTRRVVACGQDHVN